MVKFYQYKGGLGLGLGLRFERYHFFFYQQVHQFLYNYWETEKQGSEEKILGEEEFKLILLILELSGFPRRSQ